MKQSNVTFAVCAYKESPYLEQCICSLKKQTMESSILVATSTPNQKITDLCEKYDIPLYINSGEKGITQDWNFALSHVKTKYAVVTHQDDVYEPDYAEQIVGAMNRAKKPLIAFSHYFEIRNGERVYHNKLLSIKKLMLVPLKFKIFWSSRFIRRRILSIGDPICCPSVMFVMKELKQPIFRNKYRSCEDWEAWEKISRMKGSFVYIDKQLMGHRIHGDSATTAILEEHARTKENYEMYCKFWPRWIARCINRFYTKSEKSNKLERE